MSVGGEIGEVGGKNSTPEELHAFMKVYNAALGRHAPGRPGISKISIQTGTSHGGVPLPHDRILDLKPELLHQRTPLVIGSKRDVEECLTFLNEKHPATSRDRRVRKEAGTRT